MSGTAVASIAERFAWLIEDEFEGARREAREIGAPAARVDAVSRSSATMDDGSTISALRWGAGAPQAVLLHGGGLNAHSWDSVLVRTTWSAVALDLPGHGDSSWRADFDYSPAAIAETVVPFLIAEATAPVTLVGQSLGGLVAMEIAGAVPELISSLVIVDISPGRRARSTGSEQIRAFVSGRPHFDSFEDVVEHALAMGIGTDRESLERGVILNTRVRADGKIVFKHHFASPPADVPPDRDVDITYLWNHLERLEDSRIHLVRGRRGFVTADEVREFAGRFPRATVTDLDAGHNVQRDAPHELAGLIDTLIGGSR